MSTEETEKLKEENAQLKRKIFELECEYQITPLKQAAQTVITDLGVHRNIAVVRYMVAWIKKELDDMLERRVEHRRKRRAGDATAADVPTKKQTV